MARTVSSAPSASAWDRLVRPEKIGPQWLPLLRLIPGYDPLASAEGCRFDPEAARLALDFFPECLHHIEGDVKGQPFVLEQWEQAIVANLFGWKRQDAKGRTTRRYRECLIYVPRGNGKTSFAAGLCLLGLFCDGEPGAQIYSAAAEREQAALLYRQAKGMVEQEPELSRRCRIYGGLGQRSIVLLDDQASSYKVLSADAETKHGFNTHLAVVDELHAHPSRDLVDVLKTSMGKQGRRQPLMVYITTADFERDSICNEVHKRACLVRDNGGDRGKPGYDPSFLPVIYELDREADWTAEESWAKANPNLGVSVSLDYLRSECQKAKETPAYENTFKRLHLNMKTETDVRAVPMDRWDACASLALDPAALEGRACYAGLDLSTTTDLSALCLLFPPDEELDAYCALLRFWAPREGARKRERRDRVPYEQWARQGWLKLTEGDVIDYDVIRADINADREKFDIREIAADRWNATQLLTQLAGDGFEVVAYGQGFRDMTAPMKELLALVTSGRLAHGGNPVLRWMAANLATESDAAGNLKPSKKKSTERIDGMVALTMALGRAMLAPALSPSIEVW